MCRAAEMTNLSLEFEMQDEPTVDASSAPLAPVFETMEIDVESLYKTHHKFLFAFVRRYVRNVSDAEDVVQSTFLEATRCAAKFASLSKPSTWLFGIALNLSRNHVRRQMPSGMFVDVDEVGHDVEDPFADPARLVESRELVVKSLEYIDTLSDELQATFAAVLGDEQTYKLAARDLQIPIGTVRSRLSRVRGQLRALTESCHDRTLADH
jgi:RNA polymerase sigma factor (sigma-70 family)